MPFGKRFVQSPSPAPAAPQIPDYALQPPGPPPRPTRKGYSKFVALSKWALLLVVLGIVAAVVWTASRNTGEQGSRIIFTSTEPLEKAKQNIMLKPHYQGLDAKNQPYTVIAERAVQQDRDTVSLESIRADMAQQDGNWFALNAAAGTLNMTEKQLTLSGGVTVFADGGYEFYSDQAYVDIQNGSAKSDTAVRGQGPAGTLAADRFSYDGDNSIIHFNGSVKVVLYP